MKHTDGSFCDCEDCNANWREIVSQPSLGRQPATRDAYSVADEYRSEIGSITCGCWICMHENIYQCIQNDCECCE